MNRVDPLSLPTVWMYSDTAPWDEAPSRVHVEFRWTPSRHGIVDLIVRAHGHEPVKWALSLVFVQAGIHGIAGPGVGNWSGLNAHMFPSLNRPDRIELVLDGRAPITPTWGPLPDMEEDASRVALLLPRHAMEHWAGKVNTAISADRTEAQA